MTAHAASAPVQIMVWISATDDFPSWPLHSKLDRYTRVVEWHDYIEALYHRGKVTHVWGSHQLLSRAKFTTSQGVLMAVYNVSSWKEFDELLIDDPLRDVSQYVTTPLTSLLEDKESDLARYEHHKQLFLGGADPVRLRTYEEARAKFNQKPDYVGKQAYHRPTNPRTPLRQGWREGDPLQILLLGVNPEEYITDWDDLTKLIHHEKVMWWHDYTAMLIEQRKISHCWGTNDFCHISSVSGNSAAALTVFTVATYEEFDALYKLDPIRQSTMFWSVLLQPAADQRVQDERRLERAVSASRRKAQIPSMVQAE